MQTKIKRFVNLTNHPSDQWDEEQREEAMAYGEIMDMPFPDIDPNWDKEEIVKLADDYMTKFAGLQEQYVLTVHLMGEFTFCASLLRRLQAAGIPCVASCSERISIVNDHTRTSLFHFVRFRAYE